MLLGLYRRSSSSSGQRLPDASFHAALDSAPPANPPSEDVERVRSLLGEQRSAEALALVPEIISRQTSAPALRRVGDALLAAGHAQAAMQAFGAALALQADDVSSLLGQARSARLLGLTEDAVDSLEVALAHDPKAMGALLELAGLYQEAEAWREAASLIERALQIEPERADLWLRIVTLRDRCQEFDAAASAGERALALDPASVTAWNIVGMLHLERFGDPHRAESCFRQALSIDSSCDAARANLGLALQEQGLFDAALAHYEDAIARRPDYSEYRWNRGLAHLIQGNFAAGWADYESRFDRSDGRSRRSFPFLPWDGEFRPAGALLVYAEQGLGDEIMFASCLQQLCDREMAVVLECNPRLESLFRRSFDAIEVRGQPRGNDRSWLNEFPALSRQVAIGSLGRWLRPDVRRFPAHRGYLKADPVRTAQWRERLAGLGDGLSVGLIWRAGTLKTRGSQKSIPLDTLRPILDLHGVHYICMQHDLRGEERELLAAYGSSVSIWPEALTDLEETAALCAALDLTIAVPSTNAHLAGALGRPVWILLNPSPEWRWLWRGESSPWYPSARLIRQQRSGDWRSVVEEVRGKIIRLVVSR